LYEAVVRLLVVAENIRGFQDLRDRTKNFALSVVQFFRNLPEDPIRGFLVARCCVQDLDRSTLSRGLPRAFGRRVCKQDRNLAAGIGRDNLLDRVASRCESSQARHGKSLLSEADQLMAIFRDLSQECQAAPRSLASSATHHSSLIIHHSSFSSNRLEPNALDASSSLRIGNVSAGR